MDPDNYSAALQATINWLHQEPGFWDFGRFNRAINAQFYPLLNLPFPLPDDWDESRKTDIHADAKRQKREIFCQALQQLAKGNDLVLARKAATTIPTAALLTRRRHNVRKKLVQPAPQNSTTTERAGAIIQTPDPPSYDFFVPAIKVSDLEDPPHVYSEVQQQENLQKNEPEDERKVREKDEEQENLQKNEPEDEKKVREQDVEQGGGGHQHPNQNEDENKLGDPQSRYMSSIKNHHCKYNEDQDIPYASENSVSSSSASPIYQDHPSLESHPDRSNFNSVRHSRIDHKRCTLCCSHLFTNIDCTECCGSPIGPIQYNSESKPPNSTPISGTSCHTATGSNPSFNTDSDVNLRIASLEECLRAHEDRIKAQEDFASEMRNISRLRRELEESICKKIDGSGSHATIPQKRIWSAGDN